MKKANTGVLLAGIYCVTNSKIPQLLCSMNTERKRECSYATIDHTHIPRANTNNKAYEKGKLAFF